MYNQQGTYNTQPIQPQYNQPNYNGSTYEQPMTTQPQNLGRPNYAMTDPTQEVPQQANPPPMGQSYQFSSQNIMIDSMLQNEKPGAPTLLYSLNQQTFGLPIKRVNVKLDFHIGVVFGMTTIIFNNNTPQKVSGTFAFPGEGTVTDVDIQIGTNRFVGTTYVSSDDANKHLTGGKNRGSGVQDNPNDRYIPGLFRCPVNKINPGDDIVVKLTFMQPVEYIEGRYQFTLPLSFGPGILPQGQPIHNIIYIESAINCLTPGIQYGSASHNMIMTNHQRNVTHLVAAPLPQNPTSIDFHFAYTVQSNVISAMTIVSPPDRNSYDQRSSFVTFVNPPTVSKEFAPRDIIFLVDRSGSMAGQPWQNAAVSLKNGLDSLHQGDRFGIVCFDHEASFFNGTAMVGQPNVPPQFALYNYNPQVRDAARRFIEANPARGGTNIRTPLVWAMDTLKMNKEPNRIPFVVLITDGAVRDEKEIVRDVQEKNKQTEYNADPVVRILTFGIGQHCNWYFLKMLGMISQGWSSGALAQENLQRKMKAMIDRASQPVLVSPDIVVPGIPPGNIERVPQTIPDLFIGGPLVIAGKFSGQFPMECSLVGLQPNTAQQMKMQMEVRYQDENGIPVSKLFVKNQLDQMVANHWLGEDPQLKQRIIDTSVNEQLPTPHTTMIAYEMDAKQKQKMEKEQEKNKGKAKKKGPSAGTIAKYAGGAVALTAGAVLAGSIAMTMSGGSGFGAIGDLGGLDIGNVFGGGCCDCCGDLFGGICGDFCGDICGSIGDVFGDVCGGLGDLLGDCACCGEIVGALGDVCGEVVGCISECPIEEICTGCIDLLSGLLDAL